MCQFIPIWQLALVKRCLIFAELQFRVAAGWFAVTNQPEGAERELKLSDSATKKL